MLRAQIDNDRDSVGDSGIPEVTFRPLPFAEHRTFAKRSHVKDRKGFDMTYFGSTRVSRNDHQRCEGERFCALILRLAGERGATIMLPFGVRIAAFLSVPMVAATSASDEEKKKVAPPQSRPVAEMRPPATLLNGRPCRRRWAADIVQKLLKVGAGGGPPRVSA